MKEESKLIEKYLVDEFVAELFDNASFNKDGVTIVLKPIEKEFFDKVHFVTASSLHQKFGPYQGKFRARLSRNAVKEVCRQVPGMLKLLKFPDKCEKILSIINDVTDNKVTTAVISNPVMTKVILDNSEKEISIDNSGECPTAEPSSGEAKIEMEKVEGIPEKKGDVNGLLTTDDLAPGLYVKMKNGTVRRVLPNAKFDMDLPLNSMSDNEFIEGFKPLKVNNDGVACYITSRANENDFCADIRDYRDALVKDIVTQDPELYKICSENIRKSFIDAVNKRILEKRDLRFIGYGLNGIEPIPKFMDYQNWENRFAEHKYTVMKLPIKYLFIPIENVEKTFRVRWDKDNMRKKWMTVMRPIANDGWVEE